MTFNCQISENTRNEMKRLYFQVKPQMYPQALKGLAVGLALANPREADAIARIVLGKNHPLGIQTFAEMALHYLENNDCPRATEFVTRAWKMCQVLNHRNDLLCSLIGRVVFPIAAI